MRGKEWGKLGGRPRREREPGSAPQLAQKAMVRPLKWEPQVGCQLQAVRFIRNELKTRRLGNFTQEEGAEEKWEEPAASDVEEGVWSDIREE